MTTHELKTWPEPFAAMRDGRKTFEIRKDDRGFQVGDSLLLREYVPPAWKCADCGDEIKGRPPSMMGPSPHGEFWNWGTTSARIKHAHGNEPCGGDPDCAQIRDGHYTGQYLTGRVTFKAPGGAWGLPVDLCVLAVALDGPLSEGGPHCVCGQDLGADGSCAARGEEGRHACSRYTVTSLAYDVSNVAPAATVSAGHLASEAADAAVAEWERRFGQAARPATVDGPPASPAPSSDPRTADARAGPLCSILHAARGGRLLWRCDLSIGHDGDCASDDADVRAEVEREGGPRPDAPKP